MDSMLILCRANVYFISFAVEYLWLLYRIADLLKDGRLARIRSAYDENTKGTSLLSN